MTEIELRALAKRERLLGVDYLDSRGRRGARGKAVHRIRLKFSDGTIVDVRPEKMPKDIQFRLVGENELN